MRVILPLIALVLATGAAARQTDIPALDRAPLVDDRGAQRGVPMFDPAPLLQTDGVRVCRDRVHQVRDARGLPQLDRENASADEVLLIAAIDQRIDGCSVMVMRNDLSDIRPLPTGEGAPRMQQIPDQ